MQYSQNAHSTILPPVDLPTPTHPYLASQGSGGRWGGGGGGGGLVARPGGRGTGKARGDLPAVQSCGQETRGAGKGEAERAFSVALQNKNALQSRVFLSPADFEVELARRWSEYCAGGQAGTVDPASAESRCGQPRCRRAGGRREPGGRSRAGRGRGEARRGPGEAGPPPPPAPRLPRRARSSVCLLAGGSRTRGACKHSDTRFFPIKIHFHFF